MDDLLVRENPLLACSESHAVAVGMYGHLYVWGSSMSSNRLLEEISICKNEDPNNSSTYDVMNLSLFTAKIGFQESSHKYINKPAYFSLKHPIYDIKATQVSCARNFTAVVAVEKCSNEESYLSEYEKLLFELEITEGISEFRSPTCRITEEDYPFVLLTNKIRHEIDEYLKINSMTFINLFKSSQIKIESFINIITQIVKSQLTHEEIYKFLEYKKMRLAGKTVTLKPLYELINKCPQGKGVLYILGNNEILPKQGDLEMSFQIKHNTLVYNLISLPERIYVSKVACGDFFVLFLSQKGKVYSWGTESTPSLGKNRSLTLRQIKAIPELDPDACSGNWHTIDICCGSNHCLALSSTGIVYTWGDGSKGKLGNGRLDGLSRPEPINIDNNDVVMIRAGHHSSFCKTKDKNYFAWGDISSNKFGYTSLKTSDKPFQFSYDFEIIDIAIGMSSSLIIAQNGTIYQTNKSEEQITCLNRKYKHLEGVQFYQASTFGENFFALSCKGTLYSWNLEETVYLLGRPNEPQVPWELPSCIQHFLPKELDEKNSGKQMAKEASRQVVKVACTEENTFLITDKGEAIVCGDNELGQMCVVYGDLDVDDEQHPDQFPVFQLIPRLSMSFGICIREIECGAAHVLAINEYNKVMAWGANSFGQLGHGFFSKSEKYPDIISALKNESIKMVSAGSNYSMVLNAEGQVFSFGCSEFGKLGIGKVNTSILFSTPKGIPGLRGVKKISCGENHSAAISRENEILVWGCGWNGQLGVGTQDTIFEPTSILTKVNWKDVACGTNHTVGLSMSGTVYHWGEVCMEDEEKNNIFAPIKVEGIEEIHIKRVYASNGYSVALTEIGTTIYSWGKQMYKRIADPRDSANGVYVKPLSVTLPYNEKIVDVNIGTQHAALVTDQGKVYTWGYSYGGRLGEDFAKALESKPYNGRPVDLSHILSKAETDMKHDYNVDIQNLLQSESLLSKEQYLREVDQQILTKFKDCIDYFIKIANLDEEQDLFFSKAEHKQLSRLQQKPFEAEITLNETGNEEINKRIYGWSALLTTFQIHCCYMNKLLSLKIKDEKKLEMMGMIYCDMEKDLRLMYTGIYLARLLLNKLLSQPDLVFPDFLNSPESNIYRSLLFMIISASDEDMSKFRKIAMETLHYLSQSVNADEFGIDLDPTHTPKNTSTIKISAYQVNKNIIDRRMGKLKQILSQFVKILDEFWAKEQFSEIIYFITKDLLSACSDVFDFNYKNLENFNLNSINIINTVMSIVFEPLCKALENPDKYYVIYGFVFENKENNLKALAETVSKFLDGTELGSPSERWLNDINKYLKLESHLKIKAKIVAHILTSKSDLEEKYIESIFLHSLEPNDKISTVSASSLVFLHKLTDKYLESLRVGNPSYDPLSLILQDLNTTTPNKLFNRNDHLNLPVYTRCLRQDQSLARCPNCHMLIPRAMAPVNFKPVIDIYDPMPPDSSEAILTFILSNGPRKQHKGKILDYIQQYEENYQEYLKDFSVSEKVKNLILNIDTITASGLEIAIEDTNEITKMAIENNREKIFKVVQDNCSEQYKRRIRHSKLQIKISNSLNNLETILRSRENETLLTPEIKSQLIFNLEYGASNLELENFSDTVMFSIYANKIREYTSKKDMSINLFANLTNEMKDSLRGFTKRPLKDLIKRKIVVSETLSENFKLKNIVFCFEFDSDFFIIFATNSPSKLNICGRDEFREEEVLFYEKISDSNMRIMREEYKASEEREKLTICLPTNEAELRVEFSVDKLLMLMREIEEKVTTYIQNMKISQTAKENLITQVKKDNQILETVEGENGQGHR